MADSGVMFLAGAIKDTITDFVIPPLKMSLIEHPKTSNFMLEKGMREGTQVYKNRPFVITTSGIFPTDLIVEQNAIFGKWSDVEESLDRRFIVVGDFECGIEFDEELMQKELEKKQIGLQSKVHDGIDLGKPKIDVCPLYATAATINSCLDVRGDCLIHGSAEGDGKIKATHIDAENRLALHELDAVKGISAQDITAVHDIKVHDGVIASSKSVRVINGNASADKIYAHKGQIEVCGKVEARELRSNKGDIRVFDLDVKKLESIRAGTKDNPKLIKIPNEDIVFELEDAILNGDVNLIAGKIVNEN